MGYDLDGSLLRVSDDLEDPLDTEFDIHSSRLLGVDSKLLTLDLTGVEYMGSWYLGRIADLSIQANLTEKGLKIIASDQIAKIIRLAGLDKMVEFEEV